MSDSICRYAIVWNQQKKKRPYHDYRTYLSKDIGIYSFNRRHALFTPIKKYLVPLQ